MTVYISDERDKGNIVTIEKDLMLTKGLPNFMPSGGYFVAASQLVSSLQASTARIHGQDCFNAFSPHFFAYISTGNVKLLVQGNCPGYKKPFAELVGDTDPQVESLQQLLVAADHSLDVFVNNVTASLSGPFLLLNLP